MLHHAKVLCYMIIVDFRGGPRRRFWPDRRFWDKLLRLMLAIDQSAESNWEIESTNAIRNFWFKGGKFSMVVYAVFDSTDTDVEIQTAEPQFERLIKKTNITSVCEDWFLNSIETLFIEMKSRIKTSANKE